MIRPKTEEMLRRVAEAYAQAAEAGRPPVAAVADLLGVSRHAAAQRVMRARKAGFLPSTEPGRCPRINAKVIKVAEALGVDPLALAQAVTEHADGDLRIRFEADA